MTDYLQKGLSASNSQMQFQIEDVSYFRIGEWYRCQFKVKLHRENGTDTTGIVQGKISTDYATVIK